MMSKRKKHNQFKRAQRFFSNTRLWSWESMRERDVAQVAFGMTKVGMVWRDLSQQQVEGIVTRPNNLIVVCRALCATDGDEWVESEIRAAKQLKVREFEGVYKELRSAVLESVQLRHVVDLGWLIQTYRDDLSIDNESLPLFQLGPVSAQRRASWLQTNELLQAA